MSWLVPLYVGILYFCLGLAVLNAGIFNNGPRPTATATITISSLVSQPIPTGHVAGYLPYKPSAPPWLDNMRAVWVEGNSPRSERQRQQEYGVNEERNDGNIANLLECQPGKKNCGYLGHPEICCNENHTCLPTNNTLTGVYCCSSPDFVKFPCDDINLKCELNWYQCSASTGGGCCQYGQSCGPLECYDDGGPTSRASFISPTETLLHIDINGGSITERNNSTIIGNTVIQYTSGTTSMVAVVSAPTSSSTAQDIATSNTFRTGGPITYVNPTRPEATTISSAAGSRAKVGRHWSWVVMAWWIISAIVEGVW